MTETVDWGARIGDDAELLSVLVCLEPLGERGRAAVDLRNREFASKRLLGQGLSSGERVLVELARALWRGDGLVDVAYIACNLDGRFFQAAMDAIATRGRREIVTNTEAAITKALAP